MYRSKRYNLEKNIIKNILDNLPLEDETRKIYNKRIQKIIKNFPRITNVLLEKAKILHFNQYFEYLARKHYSLNTLILERATIQYWFKEKYKKELLIALPDIKNINLPKIKILTKENLIELLNAGKNFTYNLILKLIYSSGLRLDDALSLKLKDIDYKNLIINIQKKTYNTHQTILSKFIIEDLEKLTYKLKEDDFIFTLESKTKDSISKPISNRTLELYFRNVCKSLNYKNVTIKTLRDNFALHLLKKGIDKNYLISMMGLKSLQSINRLIDQLDEEEVKILSPLEF